MTEAQYITTAADLAALLEVNRSTIYEWMRKGGFPRQYKGKGWRRDQVLTYKKAKLAEQLARREEEADGGGTRELQRRVLQKRIDRLEVQISRERFALERDKLMHVTRQEMMDVLISFANLVRHMLRSGREEVVAGGEKGAVEAYDVAAARLLERLEAAVAQEADGRQHE